MDTQVIPIADRESWLALRRNDITASDMGAVCGVHPERSALQVFAEKAGLISVDDNAAMRRGRWLEDGVIFAVNEARPGWDLKKPGVYLRSPSLLIGATPDAWSRSAGSVDLGRIIRVVQCKVVSRPVFEEHWNDGPPIYYQLQALTEAKLIGTGEAYLAALVLDTFTAALEIYPVDINDGAWAKCVEMVARFWADIAAGLKPRADYTKDADVIARLYKAERPEPADLSGDNRLSDLCAELIAFTAAEKMAAAARSKAKAEIIEKLAGHQAVKVGDFTISNVPIHVKEHVRKSSDYDRLTIKAAKDKAA